MNLFKEAGIRISPPRPEDNGVTYYEMFVKATGEIVTRGTSRTEFEFIIRGKERRRHPRAVANERRAMRHGTKFFTVANKEIVLFEEL